MGGADHGTRPWAAPPISALGGACVAHCLGRPARRWGWGIPRGCAPFSFSVLPERLSYSLPGAECGRRFSFSGALSTHLPVDSGNLLLNPEVVAPQINVFPLQARSASPRRNLVASSRQCGSNMPLSLASRRKD